MSNPFEERLAEAMAEFEQTRVKLDAAAAEAARISVTVMSKDRTVEATVGPQGELSNLRFPTNRYRTMAPAELANVITATITAARSQAASRLIDVYGEFGPLPGLSRDAENGVAPVDWDELFAPLREDPDLVVPPTRSAAGSGGGLLDELVDDEDETGGTERRTSR